jgi:predicted dehydrogenase
MRAPNSRSAEAPQTRREILRRSGGVLAATAVGEAALPLVHAGGSDMIRLALVGCGGRGTGAAGDALSTTGGPVQLYAMADLFEDRLQSSLKSLSTAFKEKVDVTSERSFLGFDAYKKAIDCLSPGDVVLLTTHAAFRPLMFDYAVKKGVNVFMEKSFATDAPNTRRLLKATEAAERKNLKVGVGFMWRHSQAREEAIRRIHDGMIGDVHTLRIYRVHGPTDCPKLPPDTNELAFQIRHAFSFNWLCSGFLIDWHCHNIDVACWAKGAWPVSAQGMGGRCYPEVGNLLDHYTVEFTFPDGTKLFSFSRHMNGCWETYADYAHGTKGSAVLMTNLATPNTRLYKSQNMTPENLIWRFGQTEKNPYVVEWQLLLDAIRQDKPHNEARRAIEANFTALMGRAAVHTGQFVTIDEIKKSNFQYVKDIDHMTFDTPPPIRVNPDGSYSAPLPGLAKEI